jgi:hypothetical protein
VKIPILCSPLLVSAVRDAILYQSSMLRNETVHNKEVYEEHDVQLGGLLEYMKGEYKAVEEAPGIPLERLL